ncbi:MAG: 50S ribosomal protein L30 [Alphaproteobacteria bacterium]|nr:50S ribosomal protein L30 [Alphaproteobacteria bacterium]
MSEKKICVTQIKSCIGCVEAQRQSLLGLGLGRIGKKTILEDNGCTRGLINKVSHLVRVVDSNE